MSGYHNDYWDDGIREEYKGGNAMTVYFFTQPKDMSNQLVFFADSIDVDNYYSENEKQGSGTDTLEKIYLDSIVASKIRYSISDNGIKEAVIKEKKHKAKVNEFN